MVVPAPAATVPVPALAVTPKVHVATHIVIHEYISGDCALYLGDRMVVVDNGDPDWKHGFKVNIFTDKIYKNIQIVTKILP